MSDPTTSVLARRRPAAWRAVVALFGVTLIWGCTFVWMKQGMRAAEIALGPGHASTAASLFMLLRFGLAALCMLLFVPAARRELSREAWIGGLWIGGLLFVGFVLQMLGLAEVTPAVSAFLTSLYVLFTALLTAASHRVRPSFALCAGVVLATLGAGFIRGRPELAFSLGELLTVGGALVFALHILATDRITKRVAPMAVTLTSFAWAAALSGLYYAFARSQSGAADPRAVRELLAEADFITPVALSSVFATVLALSLMNLYQRELDPVRAAILYALEPIWAALVAIAMGMDAFDPHLWLGGALLLCGNLVAEIGEQRAERRAASA
jgi:drug/metabolite transporter (DMT)-like permease